ncbi:SDR family NAD(P)-dependent oxidoreductase [Streptomyces sp. NBC_01485]|uniref:type I polyketide synthase n=1 Tax=Streptomyces sp. NBC_01485 TaxID=2903884 RepID=UPI002E2F172F|nr:SDR family NAD(P)-dependent oxidoreductase [Streptomyces sp. NBC_01485]
MENEEKLREYLKRVTADLRRSRQRLRQVEEAGSEPIAVVGMACRFPGGVGGPEELWRLVVSEKDAIGPFPTDRGWPAEVFGGPSIVTGAGDGVDGDGGDGDGGDGDGDGGAPGSACTDSGGFLYDAGDFDAGFFSISPREALAMDPQQRLVLETSWEALEHAGLDPHTLRGSRTGVFLGAAYSGYTSGVYPLPEGVEGHLLTGNVTSAASGRIAYTLGLEGPAVTVDTACSSSLVALHLAVQALRGEECAMALAGGVTVMTHPSTVTELSKQRGLSSDGRCKAFAAGADGFGSAEGVGMLLVERLSDAQRLGHRVLAVLRGSAVNQDGASNGLTAPNGPAQERVIRQALANARLAADQVDVIEAHGTGTALGDPIEAQALLATYGQGREDGRPVLLGSVKSNIGHTQAAAGVAGVIKMVLAMRAGLAPRTLHVDEPTPHVDWTAGALELLTESAPWPETGRPRRAAVSSFGISGTNAHMILEQAPAAEDTTDQAPTDPAAGQQPVPPRPFADPAVLPWPVSGHGPDALAGQAERLADHLAGYVDDAAPDPAAFGRALARRAVFADRAVVFGADPAERLAGLRALASDTAAPQVVTGAAAGSGVVFVFSGQGGQWAGMARELLAESPVFGAAIAECEAALAPYVDWSLTGVLGGDGGDGTELERVDVVQPVLWAVMVSLAALWRSVGVRPSAVVGHSQGEIAAACVAGALSLEDAARVAAVRAQVLAKLTDNGWMVSVEAGTAEVEDVLSGFGDGAVVAAVNGPESVVVSGGNGRLDDFVAACTERGLRTRRVAMEYASHSPVVEAVKDEIIAALDGLTPQAPDIPMLSTYTGAWVADGELDAAYWYGNLRNPVRFQEAVTALAAAGHQVFVETSPHPVLSGPVQDTLDAVGSTALAIGTLRRGQGDARRFLTSAAQAFCHGAAVDWPALYAGTGADTAPLDLPTYAFQRRRYWMTSAAAPAAPRQSASDPVGEEFWAAVEGAELDGLLDTLGLDGDRPASQVLPALASWRRQRQAADAADQWCYQEHWQPLPSAALHPSAPGDLLVVAPQDSAVGDHDAVLAALETAARRVVVVRLDAAAPDREQYARALAAAVEQQPEFDAVVSLLDLDLDLDLRVGDGSPAASLALIQGLGDVGVGARLWCVTRGAVSVGGSDRLVSPVQCGVWGLGRVAALELPERWGGVVDVPVVFDVRAAGRLVGVVGQGVEDQVAVRGSGVLVRRLVRTPVVSSGVSGSGGWVPSGTVLVTGGLGGLGGHVARWLVGHGAERLVLVGRRGVDAPGAAELVAELAELGGSGVAVSVVACDVGDREALRAVVEGIPSDCPLTAVVHAAGVLDDGVLEGLSGDRLGGVWRAKAVGAWNLHEVTRDLGLEAFVLFSSVSGGVGASGQGNYAAANAFLDGLAEFRRGVGLAGVSLGWGPWGGVGLAADGGLVEGRMRRSGLSPLAPGGAVGLLGRLARGAAASVMVADVDWARFGASFTAVRPSPLLSTLLPPPDAGRTGAAESVDSAWEQRLSGLADRERAAVVTELVRTEAALILGYASADAVVPTRAFRELGFDSLTGVELRNRLARLTGLKLPAGLVFDHPTPTALGGYLADRLSGGTPATASPLAARSTATDGDDDLIAIVGMACRFPGGATSPEDFWTLLASGGDALGGFPDDRGWDGRALVEAGVSATGQGGFLSDVAGFDAGFFGISPREALGMDPQQRLLLEVGWEVFERAGVDPVGLSGEEVGVFVGSNGQDYAALLGALGAGGAEGHVLTGNAASVVSGRLAYSFGFEGPAVTVDTACSASLVALHLAGQALRSGECSLALAGGVTVMSTPGAFVEFSRQGGLASDGRCKAFGAGADGTGWGEGVGLLLVERLSDARRNGHEVLAVVRGSAVNQDGASNGLTAPSGPAQQRVIGRALALAGLSGSEVDVVEAHGTGTVLGDPIEAEALLATYGRGREAGRPLWLGSVKSNIGHTQAAAGVAGIIKMVMAMRHGVLPRTLHVDEPTPHVDWSSGGVRLLTQAQEWPEGATPRRAAVSSFGVSGTNAHVILESPERPPSPVTVDAEQRRPIDAPWLLSARTPEALADQARALLSLPHDSLEHTRADIAFSLATTRASLETRAAVVAHDQTALVDALTALAEGRQAPGLITGAPAEGRTAFLFSGQGSQRVGAGRELYEAYPVFADALDEVCVRFDGLLDRPLREVLFEGGGLIDRTEFTQPALFAVEVALFRLLESWGVVPDFVAGHSIGEVAAAYVAGVWSLDDACTLVAARGRLMGALPEGGAMLAVEASEADVLPELGERVAIAAVNGPSSVVVSGDAVAVGELESKWRAQGLRVKQLTVSHAFHSPLMDPMLAEFRRVAESLTYEPPRIPLVSNLTGEIATAEEDLCSPEYWVRHVREAVRFGDGVVTLRGRGVSTLLEVGPDGVLSAAALQSLDAGQVCVPVLRRDRAEGISVASALASLHVRGVAVDWSAYYAGSGARRVELPTYPFQRSRYWPEVHTVVPATSGSEVDRRFWEAVEREDLKAFTETIGLEGLDGAEEGAGAKASGLTELLPALSRWRRRQACRAVTDSWRYRIAWRPADRPAARRLTGTWLLALPAELIDDPLVIACRAALRRAGATLAELPLTERERHSSGVIAERLHAFGGAARDAGHAREAVHEGLASGAGHSGAAAPRFAGVLSLLALADEPHPCHAAVPSGLAATLALLHVLREGPAAPLWCVTRDAVAVTAADRLTSAAQAQVWGLGTAVALESPQLWGGLVDLPATLTDTAADQLCRLLAHPDGEDQLAIRDNGVHVRRLERAHRVEAATGSEEPAVRPGTYLITGGTGALGGHTARWLARDGAEHLLLVSRSGTAAPGASELLAELVGRGCAVTVAQCDVTDRQALARLLAEIPDEYPLTSVIHTAGVLDDGVADHLTPARLDTVLRSKATAAANLHELTLDHQLTSFVLFSSVAGTFAGAGQANYAAANAYLNALARHRRALGLPGTALAWGPWADSGMAADNGLVQERSRRIGLPPMDPRSASAALRSALDDEEPLLVVADIEWQRFAPGFTSTRRSRLFDRLPEARQPLEQTAAAAASAQAPLAERASFAALSPRERDEALLTLVRGQVALVLGHGSADGVPSARAFKDLGFDSLTAVELRNQLGAATGLDLPTTLVFDHPNPGALAAYLSQELSTDTVGGLDTLLAELDRLEGALDALPPEQDDTRSLVAVRLGAVLSRLSGGGSAARRADSGRHDNDNSADVVERLQDADAAEVFAFIEGQLGLDDHPGTP